jgi:hypothetical protein
MKYLQEWVSRIIVIENGLKVERLESQIIQLNLGARNPKTLNRSKLTKVTHV